MFQGTSRFEVRRMLGVLHQTEPDTRGGHSTRAQGRPCARRGWLVLLFLLLQATPASLATIRVYSDYNASVYLRKTGSGSFQKMANGTPAVLEVERGQLYDIRLEGRVSFFQIARGENPAVPDSVTVTIPMTVEWDTIRMAILAILVVAAVAWAVGRRAHPRDRSAADPSKTSVMVRTVLARGEVVASYSVVDLIARGGMATVYEVEDAYGDRYAMKIPDSQVFDNEEFRARFLREVEIGTKLHHPNIVRIYDYNLGEAWPQPYIVMELVKGPSLRWVLDQDAPLPPERAIKYIRGILQALEYGHQQGIFHRDVKPANVLMSPQDVPKLSDYGIARLDSGAGLTATRAVIGTPLYMAPEQAKPGPVDGRADVYAAGVLLFEALTGRLPFHAEDQYAVVVQKLTEDAPLLSSFTPELSRALDFVLIQALARNPQDRFPSAQAFLEALEIL